MKLNIAYPAQNRFIDTEVNDNLTVQEFKIYIEAETGIVPVDQHLEHGNINFRSDDVPIGTLGLKDQDVIVLKVKTVLEMDAEIQSYKQSRREALNHLEISPQLRPGTVSLVNDPRKFSRIMKQTEKAAEERYAKEMRKLQDNPLLPENQSKLMEMIKRERIQKNLQLAYDITPEAFVSTSLLLIRLKISGNETHALVDSGAQKSVLLASVAESFGLHDLIDTQFAGMSRGVGLQHSPGRIHSVAVVLGDTNLALPCSFQVLEVGFPVLLGLDMLKAHRCVIDLAKNALVVGKYEIAFLPEYEVERLTAESHTEISSLLAASLKVSAPLKEKTSNEAENQSRTPVESIDQKTYSNSFGGTSLTSVRNSGEERVNRLIGLGFTRNEAIEALRVSNGDVELAAAFLFQ